MKTIRRFLIAGALLLTQSLEAGERGGGVGFAVPTARAPASSSPGRVTSAPVVHPAIAPRAVTNIPQSYSPAAQVQRTLPSARTYVPRSTITSGQRDSGRSTATRNLPATTRNVPATTRNVQNGNARANDAQAARRDRHESHDRDWWRQHFSRIVLFGGGYYFWDAGYWYPCWGYDPTYTYDNDGPIYAYGNLLPDQVISNVQIELQQEGYYAGPINGSLDEPTRAAIATYQRDHGLNISGTVDATTVQSLGLG
jgi:peptidoglycan hydrolase-like protein with peptidoglycan-binding domain